MPEIKIVFITDYIVVHFLAIFPALFVGGIFILEGHNTQKVESNMFWHIY